MKTLLEIRRVGRGTGSQPLLRSEEAHISRGVFSLFVCVAKPAARADIFFAMTVNATGHRGNVRYLGHDFHLLHLAVAQFAGHLGLQMRAMVPVNPARDDVHADPGNRFVKFCKLSQFLDGRFLFCNRDVTGHTFCCRRKGHAIPRFGIGMALEALQPEG